MHRGFLSLLCNTTAPCEFPPEIDLVIFLYLPGGNNYEQSKAFLEWASLYDETGLEVRRNSLHKHWMSDLTCPVLRIVGNH